MVFVANALDLAAEEMQKINPELVCQYVRLISLLVIDPGLAASPRGKTASEVGTARYIRERAQQFAMARLPRVPKRPNTIPDDMVSVILEHYFGVPNLSLEQMKEAHSLSMAAENWVGELLERYLASVMEAHDWVWCSGAMVRAVDFIKAPVNGQNDWRLLQVKNRDNSENSSSSAIRNGSSIEKWFRSFSKKPQTNWSAFPDLEIRPLVSEDGFRDFVATYLKNLPVAS